MLFITASIDGRMAKKLCHGGGSSIGKAAGVDMGEVLKVWIDVEGKPMHGDPASHAEADGGNLSH